MLQRLALIVYQSLAFDKFYVCQYLASDGLPIFSMRMSRETKQINNVRKRKKQRFWSRQIWRKTTTIDLDLAYLFFQRPVARQHRQLQWSRCGFE